MRQRKHVLIAGAGIGGLTAALALLRSGYKVSIFERVAELKEIGAGFHCTPNGTRVLYDLGLKSALEKVEVRLEKRDIRLWNTGQIWKFPGHGADSAERYGAPYLVLHRGDLHAVLVDAVRRLDPNAIRASSRCVDIGQDTARASLTLETGRKVEGDVVIGADGVHSTVRQKLFGVDNPRFAGKVAWRGLIPKERLPERLRSRVTSNWIGPSGSVTVYPVRAGEVINFAGIISRNDWRVESWIQEGSIEECSRDFQGWHGDIQLLISNIATPFKFALFLREPLQQWTVGRISLLGDACHPMTPFLGQGLNMAIEDACVLVRCLDQFSDPADALARYEHARRDRTTKIVQKSSEQANRIHDDTLADPNSAVKYIESNWTPEKISERYDWIFEYNAGAVTL